jgi:hypothetical protein
MLLGQTCNFTFTYEDPVTGANNPAVFAKYAFIMQNGSFKGGSNPTLTAEGGAWSGSFVVSAANGWAVGDTVGVLVEVILPSMMQGWAMVYQDIVQDADLAEFLRRWTENAGTKDVDGGTGVITHTILNDAGTDPWCHWTVDPATGDKSAITFD